MNSFKPDYFIHGANVLLLLAYSVRDILWLRLFALASSLIAIPYFVLQPTPLWAAVGWSTLFAAINLFQSWLLFIERRPVKLTPEEEEVRRLAFGDLPPRKVLEVLSIGSWTNTEIGEHLIEQGKSIERVSLVVRGKVRVTRDERVLGDLVAANLVGSASPERHTGRCRCGGGGASPRHTLGGWDAGALSQCSPRNPDHHATAPSS